VAVYGVAQKLMDDSNRHAAAARAEGGRGAARAKLVTPLGAGVGFVAALAFGLLLSLSITSR
jgi:hypothetical protein